MGAWQPLAEELPPEVRHFVEQLRLLKDRTGLSLVALGARTAYSKSSWQRYLNATQPPPRQAVVALCRVLGEEPERFVVRWELAVQAWPREPAQAGPQATAQAAGGGPASGTYGREGADVYEEDPTLPWWDAPEERPGTRASRSARGSSGRLLLYVALLGLVLIGLVALVGAVTLG
ncbi:helix-turn-helix domain-containing protein [Streptomyces sp. SAS_270]|uniref:helix-turn-helix domain-containing protein n=1 Tax=Streptomyces sp. SAS_270 TaxID=3412748 RepID=UPI00403C859A